jgi:hypothetical protein
MSPRSPADAVDVFIGKNEISICSTFVQTPAELIQLMATRQDEKIKLHTLLATFARLNRQQAAKSGPYQ